MKNNPLMDMLWTKRIQIDQTLIVNNLLKYRLKSVLRPEE